MDPQEEEGYMYCPMDRAARAHARLAAGAAMMVMAGAAAIAFAQPFTFPVKPVRIIVPFPPGGGADYITRTAAQKLSAALGQPFVIENRTGASGNIGTELVARSAPDGYTLLSSSSSTITAAAVSKVSFDVVNDFSHVSMLGSSCLLVSVHPSLPVKTLSQLVAFARARPGAVNYASSGAGTSAHLVGEVLQQSAGLRLTHVPYKGNPAAIAGVLGGEVAIAMPNLAAVTTLVKAGRLRALAVTCDRRTDMLPDVPTVAEAGYPAVALTSWWGLSAPAGTPREIVSRLGTEVARLVSLPDVQQAFASQGAEPRAMAPGDFDKYVRAEATRWKAVVEAARIRND
jgi:tripartite-type tricarboxylate transporter receptor subunit TctC